MENMSSSNFTDSNFSDSRGSGTFENSDMDLSSEDFRRRKTIGVIIRRGLKDRVVNCIRSLKVYDHCKYKIIETLNLRVHDQYGKNTISTENKINDHLLPAKDRMISLKIVYVTSYPI